MDDDDVKEEKNKEKQVKEKTKDKKVKEEVKDN